MTRRFYLNVIAFLFVFVVLSLLVAFACRGEVIKKDGLWYDTNTGQYYRNMTNEEFRAWLEGFCEKYPGDAACEEDLIKNEVYETGEDFCEKNPKHWSCLNRDAGTSYARSPQTHDTDDGNDNDPGDGDDGGDDGGDNGDNGSSNGDHDRGHGNDPGGSDPDNPGNSEGCNRGGNGQGRGKK